MSLCTDHTKGTLHHCSRGNNQYNIKYKAPPPADVRAIVIGRPSERRLSPPAQAENLDCAGKIKHVVATVARIPLIFVGHMSIISPVSV